jgi:hypothetical protein
MLHRPNTLVEQVRSGVESDIKRDAATIDELLLCGPRMLRGASFWELTGIKAGQT